MSAMAKHSHLGRVFGCCLVRMKSSLIQVKLQASFLVLARPHGLGFSCSCRLKTCQHAQMLVAAGHAWGSSDAWGGLPGLRCTGDGCFAGATACTVAARCCSGGLVGTSTLLADNYCWPDPAPFLLATGSCLTCAAGQACHAPGATCWMA